MISPHTLPGTKVVCINSSPCNFSRPGRAAGWDFMINEGEIYTVLSIVPEPSADEGFCVVLGEIVRQHTLARDHRYQGFSLRRFRRLDLPECLTSLLNTQPIDAEEKV